jgi:rhodanese-related sulfurtransferase
VRERHPDVAQVSVEELARSSAERAPLLLDARSEEEHAVSHLLGARPARDEAAALATLADVEPEREIVVYCSVGLRSAALAEKLRRHGFTRVSNLEGGIFAWANAGLPTYRSAERADLVHPFDSRWGALLVESRRAP